jgi:tryptophanyl-tRNA synthetase
VDCKKIFLENLKLFLEPLHERRASILARPGLVEEILEAGNARAREEAEETMRLVRAAMRLA